ncbi:MAG: PAS domain-containing protein [Gammaproteobacteria bacterium]|nr:PAS domain-containing protein [Gammaproteobacteria bacterium]MBU1968286.1 PAS domain-containing protein [Gammaproteobacteria bacterium]
MDIHSGVGAIVEATDSDLVTVHCAGGSLHLPIDLPTLSLDEGGVIHDCSRSFEKLLGFLRDDLVQCHISMLLPQLYGVELVQGGHFNPLLNYLCRCGHHFQVQNRKGDSLAINLNFAHVGYDGSRFLKMFVHPLGEIGR